MMEESPRGRHLQQRLDNRDSPRRFKRTASMVHRWHISQHAIGIGSGSDRYASRKSVPMHFRGRLEC